CKALSVGFETSQAQTRRTRPFGQRYTDSIVLVTGVHQVRLGKFGQRRIKRPAIELLGIGPRPPIHNDHLCVLQQWTAELVVACFVKRRLMANTLCMVPPGSLVWTFPPRVDAGGTGLFRLGGRRGKKKIGAQFAPTAASIELLLRVRISCNTRVAASGM